MSRMHECPKCGQPMEFQEADPDVGIMSSGWFCHGCEHAEIAEDDSAEEWGDLERDEADEWNR